jgi:hypothetical protein
MSTNTTTRSTATAATPGQRRKLRLLGLLAALFLGVFAPATALAEPAAAAGTVGTQISFCAPVANHPVTLQYWNGAKWVNYKNGTSGSNGCGTFRYVDAGYYYKVAAWYSYNSGNCMSSYTLVYGTGFKVAQHNRNINVGNLTFESYYYWC